jgi:hypothetical protein
MAIEQLDDIAGNFIGWQCRLRQYVVRRTDGRPSAGMCPDAVLVDDRSLGPIVTVLVKQSPENATAQFYHIVKQTHDPSERYEAAVRILQNVYYQYPKEFSDELTALFNVESRVASALLGTGRCILHYCQANQLYDIPCAVVDLADSDPMYQATYWHNAMFNPNLIGPAQILKFVPDWPESIGQLN